MSRFIVKPNKTVKEIIEYNNRCPYAAEAEERREAAIDNYYKNLLLLDAEGRVRKEALA